MTPTAQRRLCPASSLRHTGDDASNGRYIEHMTFCCFPSPLPFDGPKQKEGLDGLAAFHIKLVVMGVRKLSRCFRVPLVDSLKDDEIVFYYFHYVALLMHTVGFLHGDCRATPSDDDDMTMASKASHSPARSEPGMTILFESHFVLFLSG